MAASPGTAEPLESSTAEHSEEVQPLPLPIDVAEPRPPLEEAAPSNEAISPKKSQPPSPLPADLIVEVSPEVDASSPSPSSSPSPPIVEASPDGPQPLSPPRTAPAAAARPSANVSIIDEVAMASQEAARSQQQPRPPSPEMAPQLSDYSEPAHPPPLRHPDECTDAAPDVTVDEVVAGTSGKAAGSSPVPEATDGDTDTTPGVLPPVETAPEGMPPQQQPRPPCPEIASPLGGNSKSAQSPQPHLPAESTYVCSNAAGKVSAVASEEVTPPWIEAIDGEGALEIGAERSLQEPEETPTFSSMEAEPGSPDMAPPGFEDFKSQWLTPPNPLVESKHTVVQVVATNAMGATPDAVTGSLSSLDAFDIPPGLRSCSPTTEAAPCSPDPDMPPPGFENCKSSWLPVPTLEPMAKTTYVLPDVAPTKAMAGAFMEKVCSVPALERTDVEIDTVRSLLPPLESGTGSSLHGPLPRSPSHMIQATPGSPDTAPPGFENLKLTHLQLCSLPLVQTAHELQDSTDNEAMHVTSEEAPHQSPALEAVDLDMDATPVLAPSLESKPGKSSPTEPPLLTSHVAQHAACSLGMVPLGSQNMESLQLLPPTQVLPLDQTPDVLVDVGTKKTVTMEEVCHPLPVEGAAEEASGSIFLAAKKNGCQGPSPHLEPQASSPAVDAAATSLEIAPRSFENSESSQLIYPCLAETIDPSANALATMPVIVKSEKMSLPLSSLQTTGTYMESAILEQSPSKSEERSLPQPEQQPSSPSVKDTTCSPEVAPPGFESMDSLDQLPPPPSLCSKFEMGQMVCGCCRQLVAYPRGAVHVQCFGCSTINLVLEEHQVGKVYCGQCDTLLMYPFGAPAVKCSNCHFVTEIGERNVRPRILPYWRNRVCHLIRKR